MLIVVFYLGLIHFADVIIVGVILAF